MTTKHPPLTSPHAKYKMICPNGETFYFQSLEEAQHWMHLNNRTGTLQERKSEYFSVPLGEKILQTGWQCL